MIPFSRDPYGPDKTEYLTFYNKILATLTTMETTYAQHHQKLRERQREWIKKGRFVILFKFDYSEAHCNVQANYGMPVQGRSGRKG